jgi:hypothetical protein
MPNTSHFAAVGAVCYCRKFNLKATIEASLSHVSFKAMKAGACNTGFNGFQPAPPNHVPKPVGAPCVLHDVVPIDESPRFLSRQVEQNSSRLGERSAEPSPISQATRHDF